jgi:hypothetical protein
MVSTDEAVVSELESQRQTLMLDEAVRLVEQEHRDTGVERERFEAYLDAMTYGRDAFPSAAVARGTSGDAGPARVPPGHGDGRDGNQGRRP